MADFDISGKTFGHWLVLRKDDPHPGSRNSYWICRCTCGTERSVIRASLVSGRSTNCGCIVSEKKKGINKTHGMSKTRLFHEWVSMKRRCSNPKDKSAKSYYQKGITVCDEWAASFEPFRDWAMANGYSDDLTIDRIDNSLGYSPDNCRWISNDDQQKNKTNTIKVEYEGKVWCLRDLCIHLGFPYKTAYRRYSRLINSGRKPTADVLFAPVETKKVAKCYRHA